MLFAEAVITTANQAFETIQKLSSLIKDDEEKILSLKRAATSALEVYRYFLKTPILTPMSLTDKTALTPATINKSLVHLERLGILKEITSQKRNRLFVYNQYIEILSKGTEA